MARLIIFRELEMMCITTEKHIKSYQYDDKHRRRLLAKMSALQEIRDYLFSYEWLKHKKTIERVKTYLESGYNYKESTKKLNVVSTSAFETTIWYASKKFEESIGVDTLSLLNDNKIMQAVYQFRVGTGKLRLDNLLPSDIIPVIPQPVYNGLIRASDCRNELQTLKLATTKSLESRFKSLDGGQLAFIRYILESSDERYADQRVLIYQYMSGSIAKVDDLLLALRNIEAMN